MKYLVRVRPEETDGPKWHDNGDYTVLFRDVPEEGLRALETFVERMKELGATVGGDILYSRCDVAAVAAV